MDHTSFAIGEFALYAKSVMEQHRELFSSALGQFGSWSSALDAGRNKAGAQEKGYRSRTENAPGCAGKGSKTDLPQTLRSRGKVLLRKLAECPTGAEKRPKTTAWLEQGKDYGHPFRMHRSEDRLAYASARREIPALVSAAGANFGSWGKALYAAGIDPIYILCITNGANRERAIKDNWQKAEFLCFAIRR